MTSGSRTTPLLTPEEIAVRAGGQAPFLRLPDRATLFAARETRLRRLAAGHAMRDYLMFIAEVARAQHEESAQVVELPLPSADALAVAAREGRPPLPAETWPRDPAWRDALRRMLARLAPRVALPAARAVVERLAGASDDALEDQAERLLHGLMRGLDLGAAPLVAAALQVHWVALASQVQATHGGERLAPFGRTDDPVRCPCCGSRPVAGITRIGGEAQGYRYLHCGLCAAEWHLVRIKCSCCQSTKGISYRGLEPVDQVPLPPAAAAVQAEACAECGHYLKIVQMEKDPEVDPVADDLASLTLDLLVADEGLQRHGVNPMLLFGDPEHEPADGPARAAP